MNFEKLKQHVIFQNERREHWTNTDTALGVAKYLREEVDELIEAIEMAEIGSGAYEVASELGDIQYLLIRLSELTGIDLIQAGEMKVFRNSLKYSDHIMNNGYEPERARIIVKDLWDEMCGEEMFSIAYMKLADELEE